MGILRGPRRASVAAALLLALLLAILTAASIWCRTARGGSSSGSGSAATGAAVVDAAGALAAAAWRNSHQTVAARVLFDSKWLRLEDHTVRVQREDGAPPAVVDHWVWVDVADQVNVLVSVDRHAHPGPVIPDGRTSELRREAAANAETTAPAAAAVAASGSDSGSSSSSSSSSKGGVDDSSLSSSSGGGGGKEGEEEEFVLFRQRKYGYEGTSLAVVGGSLDAPDEAPLAAAKREVEEELGFNVCDEWIPLGRFRTDVNRGGGFVSCFLARFCRRDPTQPRRPTRELLSAQDLEAQTEVRLSREELRREVTSGGLKEVKWTATVALALLHI